MHAAGEGMAGAYHKPAGPRPNNILIYTILNQKYVITMHQSETHKTTHP